MEEKFSVHIRAAGGWTNALHSYVSNENIKWRQIFKAALHQRKARIGPEAAWSPPVSDPPPPRPLVVYIDGPHSAPSSTIFSAEHAVLVATGIGVTPFASILQSIVARFRKRRSLGDLKKVDFIWVNRDYSSENKGIIKKRNGDFMWYYFGIRQKSKKRV